jgi:hypothetical protein
MKKALLIPILPLASLLAAPLARAQLPTEAEVQQAKSSYTVEVLKGDALCGEASLLWQNSTVLAEKGIIGKPHLPEGLRKIVDRPPQGHSQLGSYATKTDIEVNGMRVVGIDQAAGQFGSVKLNFDMPAKEVFANLPGKPVMEMTEEIPGTGIQIWTEKKPRPADRSNQRRLRAHSYQNHTQVYCERSYDFNMRKR